MEWEVTKVLLGPSEQQTEETNALGRQGWQPYAVTWNPTRGYTAWFRRRAAISPYDVDHS